MKMGRHNKTAAGSSPAEARRAVCILGERRFGRRRQREDGDPAMQRSAGEGGEVLLCRIAGDRGPCRSDSREKGDRYPEGSQSPRPHRAADGLQGAGRERGK